MRRIRSAFISAVARSVATLLIWAWASCVAAEQTGEQTGGAVQAPTDTRAWECRGVPGGKSVTLYVAWSDNSTDEDGFILERSLDGKHYAEVKRTTANMDHIPDSPAVNIEAWYRVRAFRGNETSQPSEALHCVTLATPSWIRASSTEATTAVLQWGGAARVCGAEKGFKVQRSEDGTRFETVATLPDLAQTTYTDTGLAAGKRYHYRVRVFSDVGDSPFIETAVIAPGMSPSAPAEFDATVETDATSVILSWQDTSNNETGFHVFRTTDAATWPEKPLATTVANGTRAADKGLERGRTYHYRVVACNASGVSEAAEQTISLPNPPRDPSRTTWYVRGGAAGRNDGTSWADAWCDPRTIYWAAVKPGDTILLAGGTYAGGLVVQARGTKDEPVVIRPAREAPYDRQVILPWVSIPASCAWITLDGARSDDFQVSSDLSNLDENIGLEVTNPMGTGVHCRASEGVRVRFLEVHHIGTKSGRGHGIQYDTAITEGAEIAYCHIHHTIQDGFNNNSTPRPNRYGVYAVHHNLLEYIGDDIICTTGGVDIHHNILRYPNDTATGHPDGMQSVGDYTRIYNNVLCDYPATWMICMGDTVHAAAGHYRIYNNLIYFSKDYKEVGMGLTRGLVILSQGTHAPGRRLEKAVFEDILIANNTIVGPRKGYAISVGHIPSTVGRFTLKKTVIANNIVHNACAANPRTTPVSVGASEVADCEVTFQSNVISGPMTKVGFLGKTYGNAEELDEAGQTKGNTSQSPAFVEEEADNYRLSPRDTVARDRGLDLSEYVEEEPALGKDIEGNPRSPGAWDIGAYECVPAGSAEALPRRRNQ